MRYFTTKGRMRRLHYFGHFALLATAAHAANEAPVELYKGRWWSTEYIAANSGGTSMCLTVGKWHFPSGAIGQAMMKWSPDLGLFVHISKSNWRFAEKSVKVPMSITMDAGTRHGDAYTFPSDGKASGMLQINIQKEYEINFIRDFAASNSMVITFKSGNEPPWKAEMAGSSEAAQALLKCVDYIGGGVGNGTTSPVPNVTSPVPGGTSPVPSNKTSPVGKRQDNGSI